MKAPKAPTLSAYKPAERQAAPGPLFACPGSAARHLRLTTLAMPVMTNLYHQLGSRSLDVQLASEHGDILCTIGAPAAGQDSAAPILAIGIPLHGSGGCTLVVVDHEASSKEQSDHIHALLQTTAEMIEHRLVGNDERGFLLLHFHAQQALLGGPLEALAVFDQDSRFVAANRAASTLLDLDEELEQLHCSDRFDVQWLSLVGYASLCLVEPIVLKASNGAALFARATLRQTIA